MNEIAFDRAVVVLVAATGARLQRLRAWAAQPQRGLRQTDGQASARVTFIGCDVIRGARAPPLVLNASRPLERAPTLPAARYAAAAVAAARAQPNTPPRAERTRSVASGAMEPTCEV